MAKTIRNEAGQYLGRRTFEAPYSWQPPQFAACFDDGEVSAMAAVHGGSVADVPRFDRKAKVWR